MTTTTETSSHASIADGAEFAHIDPRVLVIGANARLDADLTPSFVGSIRQYGVLQPVRVRRGEDGALIVLHGQRRTLGAIEAGRATIPAHIVTDSGEGAQRIVEQMAENDHREAMRASHRTNAFRQLSLEFGLSAGQIAKRTGTKKTVVAATLAVAESKIASAVQARYDLPLDVAAALAEFEDDPETVKDLTATAIKEPGRFRHEAQRARDERGRDAEVDAARESLAGLGVREVPEPDDDAKVRAVRHLKPTNEAAYGTLLTSEAHASCPGHAAFISDRWNKVDIVFVCTDWRTHGHGDRYESASEKRSGPMTEAEKTERRQIIENNKAWKAAETVRRDWLTEFAKRKTAPKGAPALIATALCSETAMLDKQGTQNGHRLAATWLGVDSGGGYGARSSIADALAKATPARGQHIALVLVLAAYEARTGTHTWRREGGERDYLAALEAWGYTLSDVEQIARGKTEGEAAKK